MPLRAQEVLFRASSHSMEVEFELNRCNIPFVKFGGKKFLETAHVKDVIAVLRWAENQRDKLAGFRALQLLPGIGPKIARRILDGINPGKFVASLLAAQVPKMAATDWPGLVRLMARRVSTNTVRIASAPESIEGMPQRLVRRAGGINLFPCQCTELVGFLLTGDASIRIRSIAHSPADPYDAGGKISREKQALERDAVR